MGEAPTIETLADALRWLEEARLPAVQKRDFESAVKSACRWFERPPGNVPAHPEALRQLFRSVSPGKTRTTKKRLANVKWGLGRLLKLAGIGTRTGPRTMLAPAWRALLTLVEDHYARVHIGRFARFCSAHGICPADVDDAVSVAFRRSLEDELRVKDPRTVQRETLRQWNRMAGSDPRWPQNVLTVPTYSRKYVLDWDEFHPDLVRDIEAFLGRQATSDPFDLSTPIRALKPSTIGTYRDRLRRFASCLALAGTSIAELRSLADLVDAALIERGLRYLRDRNAAPLAAAVGTVLATVARDHVGLPEEKVKNIAKIAARLRPRRNGLCPKVRERLRPLKNEVNLARLFLLPVALMRNLARRRNPHVRDAQLFACALGLGLLAACALRIGALCSIREDRHLHWSDGLLKGDLTIEFAEGDLKGGEPATFPVPRELAEMVRIYGSRFRPLLDPRGSPYLFCGRDPARPRDKNGFSTQLTRLNFDRLGWPVNPHLFRHVVHLVVLRRFPGAYAMVARVLTHRSITTMIKNYSHFDAELSMRAYQRLVEDVRGGSTRKYGAEAAVVAYALDRERFGHVGR